MQQRLRNTLYAGEHGKERVRDMIVDDIRQAQHRDDKAHVQTLLHVLHHFLKTHPEVCPPEGGWAHGTYSPRGDHSGAFDCCQLGARTGGRQSTSGVGIGAIGLFSVSRDPIRGGPLTECEIADFL